MPSDMCGVCGQPIKVQIFRWTGACSGRCEKLSDPADTVNPPPKKKGRTR